MAKQQIARLELATINGRDWMGSDFSRVVVGQPLLVPLLRRLLFRSVDSDGNATLLWGQRFADCALTQPFDQIDRAVCGLDDLPEFGFEVPAATGSSDWSIVVGNAVARVMPAPMTSTTAPGVDAWRRYRWTDPSTMASPRAISR